MCTFICFSKYNNPLQTPVIMNIKIDTNFRFSVASMQYLPSGELSITLVSDASPADAHYQYAASLGSGQAQEKPSVSLLQYARDFAAAADIKDKTKDTYRLMGIHLEAYGETAVNYNRDLEVFPVVKRIIEKITGEEAEYKSPTDMGVNRAGFCITDDEVCREAACQEVIRRYLIAQCDYKKGKIGPQSVERCKLLMDELGVSPSDRKVIQAARDFQEAKRALDPKYENMVAMAMEMPDGRIITGRSSRRMVAAAAVILNAVKELAGLADGIHLISPIVLNEIQKLKTDILLHDRTSLNVEEILTALTISAATNPSAEAAAQRLTELRGCRAHCTAILSDRDEQSLKALGIDVTCDPEYVTTNLYYA
jgi:uncharacterized protein (UPF0371 family)